ncbi:hypothetical protein PT2222_60238 [Paraburkholderia tropica]
MGETSVDLNTMQNQKATSRAPRGQPAIDSYAVAAPRRIARFSARSKREIARTQAAA